MAGEACATPDRAHGIVEQPVDGGEIAAPRGGTRQLQVTRDGLQQIVEVVRHPGGQLSDRLHLLRLRKPPLRLLQLELCRAPRGDIAGDLGVTEQRPGVVADHVDDHMRPEAGAILAHAPALVFETPLLCRRRERAIGSTGGAVSFGVEAGEMLADDLLGPVALGTLRARVPALHPPFRVSCPRFFWTPICPTGGSYGEVWHEQDHAK